MDLQDYEFYMQLFKRSRKKDGMTGAEIKKHYINAFHYSVSQPTINKHLQELIQRGEITSHFNITGAKKVPAHFYQLKTKNI